MGNGVAAQMTDDRISKVQKIVAEADWSACPVPHQCEVQEFVVNGIACLIRGQQTPSASTQRPFWQEWAIRAPYAFAFVVVVLVWLYVQTTGKFPMPPITDAVATTEIVHE